MATFDFTGISDTNPYSLPAGMTAYSDTFRILNGSLKSRFATNGFSVALLDDSPDDSFDVTLQVFQDSSVYSDGCGAVFATTDGDGYYVGTNGNRIYIYPLTAFAIGADVAASGTLTFASGDQFRFTFDSTGELNIYQLTVSSSTPAYTATGLTYNAGMLNGFGSVYANVNAAGIEAVILAEAVSTTVSVDDGYVTIGQSSAITTTGFGTINSGAIDGVALASASNSSVTLADWVDGNSAPLVGTGETLSLSDGSLSGSTTTTVNPKTGYNAVIFSGLVIDEYTVAEMATGSAFRDGDQFYSEFVTDADGNFTASTGTYECYLRRYDTGLIEHYTAIVVDGTIVSSTRNITASTITASKITASTITAYAI